MLLGAAPGAAEEASDRLLGEAAAAGACSCSSVPRDGANACGPARDCGLDGPARAGAKGVFVSVGGCGTSGLAIGIGGTLALCAGAGDTFDRLIMS